MNAFTQMGMDAFNEGIASGMAPEAAANAAGDAMGLLQPTWVFLQIWLRTALLQGWRPLHKL